MNKEKWIEQIYEKFFPRLFGFGTKFSDDTYLIQDCIQETFRKLQQQDFSKFEDDPLRIEKWLFLVVKNTILKRKAKAKKETPVEPCSFLFETIISEDSNPYEALDIVEYNLETKKLYRKLHYAISKLNKNQKKLIKMKYFDGLKHREIAEKTGKTLSTIGFNAQYAIKKLQEKFKSNSLTLR